MNYQTRSEVNKAAKQSEKAAIKSSIRHWKEISTAPLKDVLDEEALKGSHYNCALCIRYNDTCPKCPLLNGGEWCGSSISTYGQAENERRKIGCANSKPERDAAIKRFRRRAKKMVKVLESLLSRK